VSGAGSFRVRSVNGCACHLGGRMDVVWTAFHRPVSPAHSHRPGLLCHHRRIIKLRFVVAYMIMTGPAPAAAHVDGPRDTQWYLTLRYQSGSVGSRSERRRSVSAAAVTAAARQLLRSSIRRYRETRDPSRDVEG